MNSATTRFRFPFIIPGQAQKEIFHNEALAMVDAAIHCAIEAGPLATPPAAPQDGQSWIVGQGATGAWSGRSDDVATWTGGGWRYVTPVLGMLVWKKDAAVWLHWTPGGWSGGELPASRLLIDGVQVVGSRLPSLPSPSGGTVIDVEARAVLDLLIATLKSHGLTN